MKTLAMSAVLLLALGVSACSKDQAENTAPVENTTTQETEVVVDPSVAKEEVQPLDAAPLEDAETAASEAVTQ